jgi:hypothetical protein
MFDRPRDGYHPTSSSWSSLICKYAYQPHLALNTVIRNTGQPQSSLDNVTAMHTVFKHWLSTGCRQIYPNPEVASACCEIERLKDASIEELASSLPAVCVNVPCNVDIGNAMTGRLQFVFTSNHKLVDLVPSFKGAGGIEGDNLRIVFFYEEYYSMLTYVPEGYLESLDRPTVEAAKEDTDHLPAAKRFLTNLLLMMRAFPNYVSKHKSRIVVNDKKLNSTELHLRMGHELEVFKTLAIQPPNYANNETHGRKMPYHERNWHWRRQPHGPNWKGHADILGVFPDGRPYHMVLIAKTAVNKPKPLC